MIAEAKTVAILTSVCLYLPMKCGMVFQGFFITKIITSYGARRVALSAKVLAAQASEPEPSTLHKARQG